MATNQATFIPTRLAALMALSIGVLLLTAGCDRRADTEEEVVVAPAAETTMPPVVAPTEPAMPATTEAANVTVADIAGNWSNYSGKTVTVVADVEEVKGPGAFTLDEDSATSGGIDNDLLVLSPKAGTLANIDDQWLNNKVRVTGVVHRFVAVDVEREIGWDLDPKLEAEYEGKRPVLIATAIERVAD